ncbi:MAG: bacterial Ig-like domain-containing protein [Oscillospiraceae bacterium]|nr:bacterial Ig-like domain-containing protein [Oscillospiraceae bacterium]
MKKLFALALCTLTLLALAACSKPEAAVESLEIITKPAKMTYLEGESFDPAGTVINAKLADGTVKENVEYDFQAPQAFSATKYKVVFEFGGQTVSLNMDIIRRGNAPEYYVSNTPQRPDSPLKGKTYFFLGSSVTRGEHSEEESMAEFIAKRNGAECIKEAASGTTLMDNGEKSYVQRFEKYLQRADRAESLDAFICQLSTNDIKYPDKFGAVTAGDKRDKADFDTATTAGAMEYIIVRARETWDCPVVFYTNSNFKNENYEKMIALLDQIQAKWGVQVIDLYRDEKFNDITPEQKSLYMYDLTHPTRAGYRDWWTPKFEEKLEELAK